MRSLVVAVLLALLPSSGVVALQYGPGYVQGGPVLAGPGPLTGAASSAAAGPAGRFYVGPGDLVTFTSWAGLQPYRASLCDGATPMVRILRASDSAELDIVSLKNCYPDVAAMTAHCLNTTCTWRFWYDVAGSTPGVNGNCAGSLPCNQGQTSGSLRAAVQFGCAGPYAIPCLVPTTNTSQGLISAVNFTPSTGVISPTVVGGLVSGTGLGLSLGTNGPAAGSNRLSMNGSGFRLIGGTSGTLDSPPATTEMRAQVGVVNGASSTVRNNGNGASGTVTGAAGAGAPVCCRSSTAGTYRYGAVGWVDRELTLGEQELYLRATRRYWGF